MLIACENCIDLKTQVNPGIPKPKNLCDIAFLWPVAVASPLTLA
jgi:hypothetical protein